MCMCMRLLIKRVREPNDQIQSMQQGIALLVAVGMHLSREH
jgi:hypothetical protein